MNFGVCDGTADEVEGGTVHRTKNLGMKLFDDPINQYTYTLIERKARVPQLQGVQGQSCS